MPNWCEGTLRIRGKRKDVVRFLTEGVNHYEYSVTTNESVPVPKEKLYDQKDIEDGYICYLNTSSVYVEGTTRGFIENDSSIYVGYADKISDDDEFTTYCRFRQAWDIDPKELEKIAADYNLSFRIFAVESGMGFSVDLWIEHGEIQKIECKQSYKNYDDFVWNCPCPDLGG